MDFLTIDPKEETDSVLCRQILTFDAHLVANPDDREAQELLDLCLMLHSDPSVIARDNERREAARVVVAKAEREYQESVTKAALAQACGQDTTELEECMKRCEESHAHALKVLKETGGEAALAEVTP